MNTPTFENLDLACAKEGKTIAEKLSKEDKTNAEKPSKELEKLVTSALAVLEEQGVYALFLFLKSRSSNEAKKVSDTLHTFLKKTPQQAPLLAGNTDVFTSLQQVAKDLDKLLLARDLLRQTLVYARYHARVPRK